MKSGRSKRWRLVVLLASLVVIALAWRPVHRHVRAARLLTDLTGGATVESVRVEDVELEGVRARRYATVEDGPPVLLLHGVHPDGIDEPRLSRFARVLADAGLVVVTPELGALSRVELDPRAPDAVGRAARALADREGRPSVGVIGISFGGGLALVAAAESEGREHIGAVMAIGAHHDVRRVARHWLDVPLADAPEPERYGPQVLAYAYSDDFLRGVPDAEPARALIAALLRNDRERVREIAETLSPQARARIDPLRHGHPLAPAVDRLRAILRAHERDLVALSPAGRLGAVRAPVFLLHGLGDPLIPSSESVHLAEELPASSLAGLVRSPLLGHADTQPATLGDELEIVHLMARFLGALESL